MEVEVISSATIKPSRPTPDHLRHPIPSLFDQANSPALMPLIFFFNSPNNINNQHYITTHGLILDRLRASFQDTLTVFYPLAGRAIIGDAVIGSMVECNDHGVPYVEARVSCELNDVVGKADVPVLDKLLMTPHRHEPGDISPFLFTVQVSLFACGGVAIGLCTNHAIGDAFSVLMLVKTWAAAMARAVDHHIDNLPRPFFEISNIFPPRQPPPCLAQHSDQNLVVPPPPQPPVVGKRFRFSGLKLAALRSELYAFQNDPSNENKNNNYIPSIAMVLFSLISCRFYKVACGGAKTTQFEVFQAVNVRSMVTPPQEDSYCFGNMVVNAIAKLSMNNKCNNNELLRELLEEMKESIMKIDDGFVKEMQDSRVDLSFMMGQIERAERGEIALLGFSNLRSLPVYEADFGWGKPVWVTSATLPFGDMVILIPAGTSTKDIDAYVNLSDEDMAKLKSDDEFVSFLSSTEPLMVNSKL